MTERISSSLTTLECPECGRQYDPRHLQTFCLDCKSPLLARYDLKKAGRTLSLQSAATRPRGIWRWAEILPVLEEKYRLTLGEGDTPLLHAGRLGKSIGYGNIYIKDESGNPTGSFKARGMAVAVSKAAELKVKGMAIPTAGNAGGALAAYAARANMEAHVYMPKDAPAANQLEVKAFGADLVLVDGLISDAGRLAAEEAPKHRWLDISTFKEPYRLEGKKTMGLELLRDFHGELPGVIIYPTGGGTGLVGMWKAFEEMEELGWIGSGRPRMVTVQAAGCAPIVRAFEQGRERAEFWQNAQTLAAGLRVPGPFADRLILRALSTSKGSAVAVSDEEITAAQKEVASLEGILASPEGAATWAALKRLVRQGSIQPDERVVLFNTGTGLKYL
ncbi:MAG TPA: threonine synthase [Anaerolineales bacterium]